MRTPCLWRRASTSTAAPFEPLPVAEPLALTAEGRLLPAHAASPLLFLSTDVPVVGVALLLLVSDGVGARVRLDGSAAGAGLHALRHGAHLALAGTEPATDSATDFATDFATAFWVSLHCAGAEEPYDPVLHGADRHCFRLKAKLKPGEPVVPCPGVPTTPCGVLYRGAAWPTVRSCSNCGHAPSAPAWAPPESTPRERRPLHELFARAAARA